MEQDICEDGFQTTSLLKHKTREEHFQDYKTKNSNEYDPLGIYSKYKNKTKQKLQQKI